MSQCTGPGKTKGRACGLPVYALGLCSGHVKQRQRDKDRPLRPLRTEAGIRLQVRVAPDVVERLEAEATKREVPVVEIAREILTRWRAR